MDVDVTVAVLWGGPYDGMEVAVPRFGGRLPEQINVAMPPTLTEWVEHNDPEQPSDLQADVYMLRADAGPDAAYAYDAVAS